jgi:hypothetical protein
LTLSSPTPAKRSLDVFSLLGGIVVGFGPLFR